MWACKEHEVIIWGPAETGKTFACLHKIDSQAWRYPNFRGALVRKTYKSAVTSICVSMSKKVIGPSSPVRVIGGTHPEVFKYPNGSEIWVLGMDIPDKVLSSEWDTVYVNQAEELSLNDWETVGTRCSGRAGNSSYPQLLGDANPAAPSHWILSRARTGKLLLFESVPRDNPNLWDTMRSCWTFQGDRRNKILAGLTGARGMRLRDGIWAVPEGAIYECFDEIKHKVVAFEPENSWPRVVGIDPYGAYVGALWGAYDPLNGRLNIYREYVEPFGITTPEHVREIVRLGKERNETIWRWFGGGPSENQIRLDWGAFGIPLEEPENVGVWTGIDRVMQLLNAGVLVIHDCCTGLLSEIGSYKRVTDRQGNPTETIENKDSFHLLDSLRYLVVGLTGSEGEKSEVIYNPMSLGVDY